MNQFYQYLSEIYAQLAQLSQSNEFYNHMIGMRKKDHIIELVSEAMWNDEIYFEDCLGFGETLQFGDEMHENISSFINEYLMEEEN